MTTWHGRMMAPVWHMRREIVAMISRHQDGEMVARLVEKLGYGTVRGSSTRGGAQATLEMLQEIRDGRIAAMICDGPRGPIYKMKPGAAYLAQHGGAVTVPTASAARKAWVFRSWDRFMVPKPFTRVLILYGAPIPPPAPDAEPGPFAQQIEDAMNALLARAEDLARQA